MRLLKLILDNNKQRIPKLSWDESIDIKDVSMKQYSEANLRDLEDNEVVLDCESKLESFIVKKRLDEEGWGYEEWSTGSRGTHFHVIINGLQALSQKERILYRTKLISMFGTDIAKKSGFIAIENRPHFKTGKIKTLVSKIDKVNKLDINILLKIKERIEKSKPLNTTSTSNDKDKIKSKFNLKDVLLRYNFDLTKNPTDCMLGHVGSNDNCFSYTDELWFCHNDECQKGGDMFTLVMEMEDANFKEALKIMERW